MEPDSRPNAEQSLLTADITFHQIFLDLKRIEYEVASTSEAYNDVQIKILKLRMINDGLIHLLLDSSQSKICRLLEDKLLSTDDWGLLEHIQRTFDDASRYRSIGMLAAVRYMSHLREAPVDSHGRRMLLKDVVWKRQEKFDQFWIGDLTLEGRPPNRVLIETIKYTEFWVNAVGDELYNRVGALAELLRTASRPGSITRLLSPIGYFHEPINRTFRLAFEIPGTKEAEKDTAPEVTTLWQYIEAKPSPALEDLFLLARRLASTLSSLHKVGWLHKNISAFTVIFAKLSLRGTRDSAIPPPYLVGFNHSRPNDPKAISLLPQYRIGVTDYCYPNYWSKSHEVRFQPQFDWYSLGLVLLEIGLWRTLSNMTKRI
ncbi:MAG: hypothetical protein Q9212_003928 [Teloschistes hypoglaucus]